MKRADLHGIWIGILVLVAVAHAGPEIAFSPSTLVFNPVVVGEDRDTTLVVKNVGDTTLVVSAISLARGESSTFAFSADPFQLAPDDSVVIEIIFRPKTGGTHADALIFETNADPSDPTLPRPVVSVSGTGTGPEISVEPSALNFASSGIGAAVTGAVLVKNEGNDTLRVSQIFVGDSRFVVDQTVFDVLPNQTFAIAVTFTPDNSRARLDTLSIISNDFDEDTVRVVLDAQETPVHVGTARISLSRLDSLGFPNVGDTISVLLTLEPENAAVGGMEVFFGYDSTLFRPVTPEAPFVRAGYTESRLQILNNNVVVSTSTTLQVAHLSALSNTWGSIESTGALAQIDLVVVGALTRTTRLRILVEAPLFNSQYITPSGLSFTAPGRNILGLGNSPPTIKPFPPLKMEEDTPATLALANLASDAESSANELNWSFTDPDSLMVVSVSIPDSSIGPVARFFPPQNGSGIYAISAVVSDPAGATDSAVVVVDVAPSNDSPQVPQAVRPTDNATAIGSPLTFEWLGGDPDRDDSVTYEIRFGQNRLFLNQLASDLADVTYVHNTTLSADTVYFWQVVSEDIAGAETSGPIWQFTTAGDIDPPVFIAGPDILEVTDSTAAVFWSASEASSARIVFGFASDLSDSLDVQPFVPIGQIQLRNELIENLISGTQYFFQVTLTDAAGNRLVGDVSSFVTTGSPAVPNDLGDFDADRIVGFDDFLIFVGAFGSAAGEENYTVLVDINSDGTVGFEDFLLFAAVFGTNYALGKPVR